jgi:hypothetical protein
MPTVNEVYEHADDAEDPDSTGESSPLFRGQTGAPRVSDGDGALSPYSLESDDFSPSMSHTQQLPNSAGAATSSSAAASSSSAAGAAASSSSSSAARRRRTLAETRAVRASQSQARADEASVVEFSAAQIDQCLRGLAEAPIIVQQSLDNCISFIKAFNVHASTSLRIINQLRTQLDQLATKYAGLFQRHEQLEHHYAQVTREKTELMSLISDLHRQLEHAQRESSQLMEQLKSGIPIGSEQILSAATNIMHEKQGEIDRLVAQNTSLQAANTAAQLHIQRLEQRFAIERSHHASHGGSSSSSSQRQSQPVALFSAAAAPDRPKSTDSTVTLTDDTSQRAAVESQGKRRKIQNTGAAASSSLAPAAQSRRARPAPRT